MVYKIVHITGKSIIRSVKTPWGISINTKDGCIFDVKDKLGVTIIESEDKKLVAELMDNLNCGKILIINNEKYIACSNDKEEEKLLNILPTSLGAKEINIINGMKFIRDIVANTYE